MPKKNSNKVAKTGAQRMQEYRARNKGVKQQISLTLGFQMHKELKRFMKNRRLNTYAQFIEYIVRGKYAREIAHIEDYMELEGEYKESFLARATPGDMRDVIVKDEKYYVPTKSGQWQPMRVVNMEQKDEIILNVEDFL